MGVCFRRVEEKGVGFSEQESPMQLGSHAEQVVDLWAARSAEDFALLQVHFLT